MIAVRELTDGDVGFLREMLCAALAWDPDLVLPPPEAILEHPQVVVFHRGWGRAGDSGLVAEHDGVRVGAVWYRLFTDDEHGEGYVDARTPELAIAVVDGFRGRGIGRRLLEAMHDRARAEGYSRLSLSVDELNPAKRLYTALGYVEHEPGDGLGRMVLELGRAPTG